MRNIRSRVAWALMLALSAGCGGVVDQVNPGDDCNSGGSGAIGNTATGTSNTNPPSASKPTGTATYNDLRNASEWATLDLARANTGTTFNGTAFDGRYFVLGSQSERCRASLRHPRRFQFACFLEDIRPKPSQRDSGWLSRRGLRRSLRLFRPLQSRGRHAERNGRALRYAIGIRHRRVVVDLLCVDHLCGRHRVFWGRILR